MAFESLPFDPQTHYTDVRMMGVPGFGAIYLIDDEEKALVETGTSNDARAILDAVRGFGLRPGDIDHVIVSHIHLDHAGGAGFLLKEMPSATVYVHARGLKHLVDPSRLVASAASALGDMASEFGTMTPIPPDRLHAVTDGEALDLGGRVLRFLDSPGHAPHELTAPSAHPARGAAGAGPPASARPPRCDRHPR
jgi:glyoxylase-like metal-dependent hydrolase (beta-lactamase superfamily II)